MDPQEAQNRLRLLSISLENLSKGERENRLRQELKTIINQSPAKDRPRLVEHLSQAFPVWPPDVPPVPPPTDEEMIEKLRMRIDAGEEGKRRVEGLLRARELGCGLRASDIRRVRERVAIDPGTEPEVSRMVEAMLVMVQALTDIDASMRKFLQDHGAGMMSVGVPKVRESICKLLTLPDSDSSRHARLAELENVCGFLTRAATITAQWSQPFAKEVSDKLAPRVVESIVPKRKLLGEDFSGYWNEYVARLGGRKDEANMKAWLQDTMKRTIGNV